jgi:hypothetical protein
MLKQPMIEKLAGMRLLGMVEALKAQEQDPSARELSFLERFGLLVDQQWNWRENQALGRRLKNAKLRTPNACVEEMTIALLAAWIRASSVPSPSNPPGSARTRTSSSLDQQAWGRVLLRAHWRRRHAAMVTRRFTLAPSPCFVIWQWREPTEVCAVCSRGSAASMSWSSTIGRWPRCQNPSAATSGRYAKTVTRCVRRS